MFLTSQGGVSVELYCLTNAGVFMPNEASFCVRYCPDAGEGVFLM